MRAEFRVTAIVSTYNGERFLRGCLEDLVAQTLFGRGELEVVVIDSASQQREGEIAAEFAGRYPDRMRYARTGERESLFAAWNRGIGMARGEYLTNANVDDRHHPGALEKMAAALDRDAEVTLVYADSFVVSEENVTWERGGKSRLLAWPEFDRELLFETCYIGQAPMWRRAVHACYGHFDAAMSSAGDYEFWLRLAKGRDGRGEKFLHLAEPLGLYLERDDAISLCNIDLNWRESEAARDRYWNPAEEGGAVHPKFRRVAKDFARLRERLTRLPAGTRVALYGAGKHTERMWPLFLNAIRPHAYLAGILDDGAAQGGAFPPASAEGAVPVVRTEDWQTLAADVMIVSSDTYEMSMYTRLRAALPESVMIWRIYHTADRKVGVAV